MNRTKTRVTDVPTTKPKLTAAQRRRVRELIVDDGHTRAEAIAWVHAFEPDVS